MSPVLLSDERRRAMVDRHGVAANAWCDELPATAEQLFARWRLSLESVGSGGTSVILHCRRADGAAMVLKLVVDLEVARIETEALRAWSGVAAVVRLLDADTEIGALLLEAIEPGTLVSELDEPPGVEQVAGLLRALRTDVHSGFPPLADRLDFIFALWERRRADTAAHLVGPEPMARSRRWALRLAGQGPVTLLHGDLHPSNVLDGGPRRGLVVIDPRPCLGDPCVDAIDWAMLGARSLDEVRTNAERLADRVTGLDTGRLVDWCRATAVLGAVARIRAGRIDDTTAFLLSVADGVT